MSTCHIFNLEIQLCVYVQGNCYQNMSEKVITLWLVSGLLMVHNCTNNKKKIKKKLVQPPILAYKLPPK